MKKVFFLGIAFVLILSMALAACTKDTGGTASDTGSKAASSNGDKGVILVGSNLPIAFLGSSPLCLP